MIYYLISFNPLHSCNIRLSLRAASNILIILQPYERHHLLLQQQYISLAYGRRLQLTLCLIGLEIKGEQFVSTISGLKGGDLVIWETLFPRSSQSLTDTSNSNQAKQPHVGEETSVAMVSPHSMPSKSIWSLWHNWIVSHRTGLHYEALWKSTTSWLMFFLYSPVHWTNE